MHTNRKKNVWENDNIKHILNSTIYINSIHNFISSFNKPTSSTYNHHDYKTERLDLADIIPGHCPTQIRSRSFSFFFFILTQQILIMFYLKRRKKERKKEENGISYLMQMARSPELIKCKYQLIGD